MVCAISLAILILVSSILGALNACAISASVFNTTTPLPSYPPSPILCTAGNWAILISDCCCVIV
jgi:hypothetical protein